MNKAAILTALAGPKNTVKQFSTGATRIMHPDQTLARVLPLCGQFGITRVANITGLDRIGIPVVSAIRPNSRSLSVSQGKGASIEAAKASAVMESVELYHAEYIHLPLVYGSEAELVRFQLVDTSKLPSVKSTRFHVNLPILWVEGLELISQTSRWVPFEIVHTSARTPAPPGSGCFSSTSNGLASGNHIIEAILHGICEVIERDATTLWEASGDKRLQTLVDLTSVGDEYCRELISRLCEVGISVAVCDTTSDIGVASFLCEIWDSKSPIEMPLSSFTGMGCHPSRSVALARAITEAVQCRVTYIAGSRDDLFRKEYSSALSCENRRPVRYEFLRRQRAQRQFGTVPHCSHETIHHDLEWVIGRLQSVGLNEVIVVDLTKPEFDLPVVRVVVPGLEGPDDDPEYQSGRRAEKVQRAL